MTRRIIFHKSHMITAYATGFIKIIRFAADDTRQTFDFYRPAWTMAEALAWGKRWIKRVKY